MGFGLVRSLIAHSGTPQTQPLGLLWCMEWNITCIIMFYHLKVRTIVFCVTSE